MSEYIDTTTLVRNTDNVVPMLVDLTSAEEKWVLIRKSRDSLLERTDWLIAAIVEKTKIIPIDWVTYRQALRDIPETYTNPGDVIFPPPPTAIVDVDLLEDNTSGGTPTWGGIAGTLSSQTDLQNALNAKEASNSNIQAHVTSAHAPSGAQVNADITKAEIEAKLTGAISSHSHSGGADPFTAKLVLAADKPTGANTTPVTTGLSFSFEANSKYVIDIFGMVAPTAATTGCGILIDTSVAVTYVGVFVSHSLALTGTLSGATSVGGAGATANGISSGMPGTATYPVIGGGILISTTNAGTATFFFRSETTAVTTLKAGTMIRVMKMA